MRRRIMKWLFDGDIFPTEFISALKGVTVNSALSSSNIIVREAVGPGVNKVIITLAALAVTVTDALAYGSIKLLDFSKGRNRILDCAGGIQWAVTTDRPTTINDSAGLAWALGTAAASNTSLTSTMVNALPSTSKTLSAATTALNTSSNAVLASVSAQLDGTGTANALFLNCAFATGTDIDADGTLTATGTITMVYTNAGLL